MRTVEEVRRVRHRHRPGLPPALSPLRQLLSDGLLTQLSALLIMAATDTGGHMTSAALATPRILDRHARLGWATAEEDAARDSEDVSAWLAEECAFTAAPDWEPVLTDKTERDFADAPVCRLLALLMDEAQRPDTKAAVCDALLRRYLARPNVAKFVEARASDITYRMAEDAE